MPSLTINQKELPQLKNLEEILFDFGLETEVTEEGFKIDCPANRYDLLTKNGLLNALDCFINKSEYEGIQITDSDYFITNKSEIRPYISSAVIHFEKEIDMTELIAYQEKLHDTIGRDRKILAIGIHDYTKIAFPLVYKDISSQEFEFNPLNSEKTFNFNEFVDFIKESKCHKYFNPENPKFPAIFDKNNEIISLPPILNSNFTKITEKTKSILIEATGIDKVKVENALKLFLYNFRGKIEEVKVNNERISFNNNVFILSLEEVNQFMKCKMSLEELRVHLRRMMHSSESIDDNFVLSDWNIINYCDLNRNNTNLLVKVSDIRFDVMDKCDLLEDVCISYGYNNLPYSFDIPFSCGKELPFNRFTDKIREEMAQFSFTETLNLVLTSFSSYKTNLIINSVDKLHLRMDLIGGLLTNINYNRKMPLPIKIFEVGEVVIGWENKRLLTFMVAEKEECIDYLQGILYNLTRHLKNVYVLSYREATYDDFIERRSVECLLDTEVIGRLGVVSGEVASFYKVPLVCSAVEIDLGVLFDIFMRK